MASPLERSYVYAMIALCGSAPTNDLLAGLIVLGGGSLIGAYVYLARRKKTARRWPVGRILSWAVGVGLVVVALWPAWAPWAYYDMRGHMLQHLLLGMVAPLALVLAAPVTLLLRTLPTRPARRIMRILRSPGVRALSHPITAGLLNTGSLYLLYLTPLYAYILTHPSLHAFVHVHFLAVGSLFAWALVSPDPVPHRPRFSLRLGVLFVSLAAHASLSKLMYAYAWPSATWHPPEQVRQAAQWMYYGGDGAEVLLAVILFAQWYRVRSRLPTLRKASYKPSFRSVV